MTPNMIKQRFMELTVRIKQLEDKVAALEAKAAPVKAPVKKETK